MLTIISFIAVISILILIHEFGHLLAAKFFNIRAEEFAIGMGPKLSTFYHDGETEYTIRAFPIGGFVRMQGEDVNNIEKEQDPKRSFVTQPIWQRGIVLSAGVFMNYILAVVLLMIVFATIGKPVPTPLIYVSEVQENSPASEIFEPQMLIYQYTSDASTNPQTIVDGESFKQFITENRGNEVTFFVLPPEFETLSDATAKTVTLRANTEENQGALGIVFQETALVDYEHIPWYMIPVEAFENSIEMIQLMLVGLSDMLNDLLQNGTVPQDIAGPVGIAKITGEVARQGFIQLLQFMSLISLNLAVLNLLPFPALDGGRLLFLLVEGVVGEKISPRLEAWIHMFGFALLIGLMIVITYFDIQRFF